jgi:hypothetical protein
MLDRQFGIRLMLLVGPSIPRPPSAAVMNALTRVEVTNNSSEQDGFSLTFACGRSALGDYDLVKSGKFAPMTRVAIGVVFGVLPEILIDGIISHAQLNPGSGPGTATFTVMGKDVSLAMDLEEKDKPAPNQGDFMIVGSLLSDYASKYGIVPNIRPTTDVPLMIQRIPQQTRETDLQVIQRLAARNGFVFYVEPKAVGVSDAYWGKEKRVGLPQRALSVDQGTITNVQEINFSDDALAATGTKGVIVEPISKMRIPIPALPSLKMPPLAARAATPYRKTLQRDVANQKPATAATRMLAAATNMPDASTATGTVNSVRYGRALRARKLVGLSGAGRTHDGFWYVRKVTHTISRGEYEQSFELGREGTGALLPLVRR